MKLEAVTIDEVKRVRSRKKKVMRMVEDFWNSDAQAVKVSFGENEYKSIASAQSSFSKSIRRLNVGVFAVVRNGVLYLVKEKI